MRRMSPVRQRNSGPIPADRALGLHSRPLADYFAHPQWQYVYEFILFVHY